MCGGEGGRAVPLRLPAKAVVWRRLTAQSINMLHALQANGAACRRRSALKCTRRAGDAASSAHGVSGARSGAILMPHGEKEAENEAC